MTKNLKICATIEARMSSTRLPGKVMMDHEGVPLIKIMVDRIRKSSIIDDVIIATTVNPKDDDLCTFLEKEGINFYRGSEDNVLQRVLAAAKSNECDLIVELTGDCPLIDSDVIDQAVEMFTSQEDIDYVANTTITRAYPRGADVQVFATETLEKVSHETDDLDDLENVSLYIYRSPGRFNLFPMPEPEFNIPEDARLTLDYPEDFALIKEILSELGHQCTLKEICQLLEIKPELMKINSGLAATYINDKNRNS